MSRGTRNVHYHEHSFQTAFPSGMMRFCTLLTRVIINEKSKTTKADMSLCYILANTIYFNLNRAIEKRE